MLERISLAQIKSVAPRRVEFVLSEKTVDVESLKAVASNMLHVMEVYHQRVVKKVYRKEIKGSSRLARNKLREVANLILSDKKRLSDQERGELKEAFVLNRRLEVVYGFRQKLNAFYELRALSRESLLALLEEWCFEAEKAGIEELRLFARIVRGYKTA